MKCYSFIILFIFAALSTNVYSQSADSVKTSKTLKEVVVSPDEITTTHNKMIVNISNEVKRHSIDGYSMLSLLMLPGLDASPFSTSVKAYGNDVLLCINGIESNSDEIKTLNPKDVKRVDYYLGFDERHPTSRYVIDFIVKIRDYGGAVAMQANQYLNRATGDGLFDWRTFSGKTEIGVLLTGDYNHYAPGIDSYTYNDLVFNYGNVSRLSKNGTVSQNGNGMSEKFYFLGRYKHGTLKAAAKLHHLHNKNKSDYHNTIESPGTVTEEDDYSLFHNDNLQPTVTVSYDHKFKKGYLTASVNSSYSHTKGTRDYFSQNSVLSSTRENFWSVAPFVRYTHNIGNKHSVFGAVSMSYHNSEINYIENDGLQPSMTKTLWTSFILGDNYKIAKNLSINADVYFSLGDVKNFGKSRREYFVSPTIWLSYSLPKGYLSGCVYRTSSKPSMYMYSTDEKWVDPYFYLKGNPELKISEKYTAYIYWINNCKWGYIDLYSDYNVTLNSIFLDIECDNDRNAFVQTFTDGGRYEKFNFKASIAYYLFRKKLKLHLTAFYSRYNARTFEKMHTDAKYIYGEAVYMDKGFYANLGVQTPYSTLEPFGNKERVPFKVKISAGYTVNEWSVGLYCSNPFMRTKSQSYFSMPGITRKSYNYSPRERDNQFGIKLSYRFNYGKPNHKYQDVEIKEGESSAILKH